MKKIITVCLVCLITVTALPTIAFAAPTANASHSDEVSINKSLTKQDKIGYQYKVIDNILYRRLYNFTANKPLSDWEIAP